MKKLLIVLLIILALFLLYVFLVYAGIIPPNQYYPTEGIWYCEELQIQLCFSDKPHNTHEGAPDHDCCITIEGKQIKCYPHYKQGNPNFVVVYQKSGSTDKNTEEYSIDHIFYKGHVKSLSKTRLVTKDRETGETYTFYRID